MVAGAPTVGQVSDGTLFDDSVGRDPRSDTWTVPELSVHVGRLLVGAFPDDVWVEGQIAQISTVFALALGLTLAAPARCARPAVARHRSPAWPARRG